MANRRVRIWIAAFARPVRAKAYFEVQAEEARCRVLRPGDSQFGTLISSLCCTSIRGSIDL